MIYLDAAATTKMSDKAAQSMVEAAQQYFGNPSSMHSLGYEAKNILETTRQSLANYFNAEPQQTFFTSGATESNNWALESLAYYCAALGKRHIISSAIEHHSILNKLKELEKRGFKITYVMPNSSGICEVESFEKEILPETGFIVLMGVNNETGARQPWEQVGALCKNKGILFHTDATQLIPHEPLSIEYADYISCSAHKFNGPRGIGILCVKKPNFLKPLILGGKQEQQKRGGTENLPAIVAMNTALGERYAQAKSYDFETDKYKKIKLLEVLKNISDLTFNGSTNNEIPIVNFYIKGIDAEALKVLLNNSEIFVSSTSACSSGDHTVSHVLKAMGCSDEVAANSIRISFDKNIGVADLIEAALTIEKNVKFLRGY